MKLLKAFAHFKKEFASSIHNGRTTAQAKKEALASTKDKFGGPNWAALIALLMPLIDKLIQSWLNK